MFTGIIEAIGTVDSLERTAAGARLAVRAADVAPSLGVANSIAVNGCCLTVVEVSGETFAADLSSETLARTSFGELHAGTRVNLERPLTAGKELGGHFVQGHVDGVGRVARLVPEGSPQKPDGWRLSVRVPQELGRYVAMKGSIAMDGISLTIAGWQDGVVDLAIIPYTYLNTNLSSLTIGDPLNVECDVLAKYLEGLLRAREEAAGGRLSIEELLKQGF
jgi:riboflavin synthase